MALHGEAWGRLGECWGNALGKLGEGWGMLGKAPGRFGEARASLECLVRGSLRRPFFGQHSVASQAEFQEKTSCQPDVQPGSKDLSFLQPTVSSFLHAGCCSQLCVMLGLQAFSGVEDQENQVRVTLHEKLSSLSYLREKPMCLVCR